MLALAASFLATLPFPLLAQTKEPKAEVELPLSVYDQLRSAGKKKEEPPPKALPFAGVKLVRGNLTIDLDRRRASWEVELESASSGDEPPAVPLLTQTAPVGRWSVSPQTARVEPTPSGSKLVPDAAGVFHVVLAGEIAGMGEDETDGIRFPLPPLASVPIALDVTLPEGTTATAEGGVVARRLAGGSRGAVLRVAWDRDRPAALIVRRAGKAASGPPSITGGLHLIDRISDEGVRSEVRLSLRVTRGILESKALRFPGSSLVSVNGPVIATGPDAAGDMTLRFEPPVAERGSVSVALAFLRPRDPKEPTLAPILPELALAAGERLEKLLTIVAEGGLLVEATGDDDWEVRASLGDVRTGPDDVALGFKARLSKPKPPVLTVKRLKSLAVASALARVTLTVFVGENGETRTHLLADVRSRGRSLLRFKVPPDATLLAVRADGAAAAASRPKPEQVEVPVGGDGGRTRIELLLGGKVEPPRAGSPLTLPAPVPEEPVERIGWRVVLPPGLAVKEPWRKVAAAPEPASAVLTNPDSELSPGERTALELARRMATTDAASGREGAWSPAAALPKAPAVFETDLLDVGTEVPPLALTLIAKREDNPWY